MEAKQDAHKCERKSERVVVRLTPTLRGQLEAQGVPVAEALRRAVEDGLSRLQAARLQVLNELVQVAVVARAAQGVEITPEYVQEVEEAVVRKVDVIVQRRLALLEAV